MTGLYIIIIIIVIISINNVKSNENEPKIISLHNTHNHRKEKMNQYNVNNNKKKPNIILILADDLGYADTSVYPFVGAGILTPNLEKMALKGAVLTNFHTAAATCTPSRASILTGLYPWRLGIKGVYEYGPKCNNGNKCSNRDDWLAQIPTSAMIFKNAGYTTIHSGKWHLGGMRNDDIDMRRLNEIDKSSNNNSTMIKGNKRCPHPGPNQQGFDHYVSVLDGPGSDRQNILATNKNLYSNGCSYLIENDNIIDSKNDYNISGYLSQCEALHAIRMMNDSIANNKPFFTHLWFHAPHSPWQYINGYHRMYPGKINKNGLHFQYKTMITDMDNAIGRILNNLIALNIENNTIVIFLSDNGPEENTSPNLKFKKYKRFLYEGGIRVPCIIQWVGHIPSNQIISNFGVGTDLLPTFLDAADIKKPSNVYLDGVSLLPLLQGTTTKQIRKLYNERLILWHADYEGPRRTVGWTYQYKLILNENNIPIELYDMMYDKYEIKNLINNELNIKILKYATNSIKNNFKEDIEENNFNLTRVLLMQNRNSSLIHLHIIKRLFKTLFYFATYGNYAHKKYLQYNKGRIYIPTLLSDATISTKFLKNKKNMIINKDFSKDSMATKMRNKNQINANFNENLNDNVLEKKRKEFLNNGYCSTLCPCNVPNNISTIMTLPFEYSDEPIESKYIHPNYFLNGTVILLVVS